MIKKIVNLILNIFGFQLKEDNDTKTNNNIDIWYTRKKIMTTSEIRFYNLLKEILGDKYLLWPQINLATVMNKNNNKDKKQFQNELYHNIDFGVFNKDTFEVMLLIELNDESHNNPHRKKRDEKVKLLCKKCDYTIISFWLNKPNEIEYVRNRILYYLGELDLKINNTQELHNISNNESNKMNI